jgi:HEAT repeat protein
MWSAVAALAYPRPLEGTENIPKLIEESTLVCKGEVAAAPKPVPLANAPRMTGTAMVHLDVCFKGDPGGGEIRVLVDSFIPPAGGPTFLLNAGDCRLFFLKPVDGKYAVVDQWFGALSASRERSPARGGADPKLLLEQDLKAGLHDSDPERVLDSIRMLGNMKTLSSTAELKALLNTPDLLVKTYVWQALLRIKDYSVLPAVAEFFATQPEPPEVLMMPRDRLFYMQGQLNGEIGSIRSLEALPYLEKFALSDKRFLRDVALQALRQIESPHSAAVLLKELDDPDADNAFSAMQGLLSLAGGGAFDWVPSWDEFRQSPQFYAAKTREWWWAEGEQKMGKAANKTNKMREASGTSVE